MKSIIVLFFLLPFSLISQITIDQMDMPVPGDEFFFTQLGTADIDPSLTGENFIWDFTALEASNQNIDLFVGVGDTPLLYQFYFNNGFLYPDHAADVALSIGDVTSGPITLEDIYNYYKNDAAGFRQVGYGATINSLPQSYRFEEIEWVYEFPLNYQDAFEGGSFVEMSVPTLGYRSSIRDIVTTVDGWGTVQLPSGSYEVLRVKKVINQTDSLYNETVQLGFSFPVPEVTEYHFLAENEAAPVVLITESNDQITGVKFRIEEPFGVGELEEIDFSLSPNPVVDNLFVTSDENIEQLEIYGIAGKKQRSIFFGNQKSVSVNVTDLVPGIYFLHVASGDKTGVQRFVIY